MTWPAQTPDLNLIVLWDKVHQKILAKRLSNLNESYEEEKWNDYIKKLWKSMIKGIQKLIKMDNIYPTSSYYTTTHKYGRLNVCKIVLFYNCSFVP